MATKTTPETHMIAIVAVDRQYDEYRDDYYTVVQSITDWDEVDEETLKLLRRALPSDQFAVLERIDIGDPFIARTVEQFVEKARQAEEKARLAKAAKEAKSKQRKLDQIAKSENQRRQLYEQLRQEFAEQEKK